MLRSLRELIGRTIQASDGEIGEVRGFFFDECGWGLRYLVVEAGKWLEHSLVLISPSSFTFESPDWNSELFPVALSREQIKTSPDVDIERSIPRKTETLIAHHYGWPAYWKEGGGAQPSARTPAAVAERECSLRSTRELFAFTVTAGGEEAGEVEDFIFDASTWKIRYLVVDTGRWLNRKRVLIGTGSVERIDDNSRTVRCSVTKEMIADLPAYAPGMPVGASEPDER